MANFELRPFATAEELAQAAARAWLDEIESAARAGQTHCVALSGGRIAQKLFSATVEQARQQRAALAHVHFFWADERCVPPTDPDSNFKLANELLLMPLGIAENQIHRLRGELPAADAVALAAAELRRFAPLDENMQPVLDLVLLGVGEDGHVASLFPDSTENNQDISVPFLAVENSPKPPPRRISLSYAALKASKTLWILASGTGKGQIVRASLAPGGQTPMARVIRSRPPGANTKIFSDLGAFHL